jgi:hypothetical protein
MRKVLITHPVMRLITSQCTIFVPKTCSASLDGWVGSMGRTGSSFSGREGHTRRVSSVCERFLLEKKKETFHERERPRVRLPSSPVPVFRHSNELTVSWFVVRCCARRCLSPVRAARGVCGWV